LELLGPLGFETWRTIFIFEAIMYFEDDRCTHCNNVVSSAARALPFNQHFSKYFDPPQFCTESCFNAEFKKYMEEVPSKEDRKKDEESDRFWYKLYKDKINDCETQEYIDELRDEYNEKMAQIHVKRKRDYDMFRESAFDRAIWALKCQHDDGKQKWKDAQSAKRLETLQKDIEREGRELAQYLERADRQREKEAREKERLEEKAQKQREKEAKEQAERDRLQKEWDEAHKPAVVPEIPEAHWYSHCLLLAQTRFGKTNVIRWRLNELADQVEDGKASVILMEPKGVLTEELLRTNWAYEFRERVVILDPKDTRVSVNIFDKGDGSDHAIEETIARVERVLNNVTSTLTPFQVDALSYALRAMFYIEQPGSIRLLSRILKAGLKGFKLRPLPYVVEQYFADFKAGDGSAMQVVNRLNGLVANPVFEALFDSDRSTFNMFDEIQSGKLIVINASASNQLYARFWIEQVASCITPRFKIPFAKRMPTTFIIDEAQTWISEDMHFAGILDKAAEARIGMLIAAHHMNQIKDLQVRGSIYTNTAMKFAARTTEDINHLCGSMGLTEPDFVRTLPKYEFAYFGPDMNKAIKVKFPLKEFDKFPQMTEEQYQQMRAENRRKYNYVRGQPQAAPSEPVPQKISPSQPQNVAPISSEITDSDEYDPEYDDYNYTLKDPTPESVHLFLESDVATAAKMNFQRDPEQTFRIIEYGLQDPRRMKHVYANYLALIQSLNNPALLKTFMGKYRQYAPQQSDPEKHAHDPATTAQKPKSPPHPADEYE
jgi:hypothetical protein